MWRGHMINSTSGINRKILGRMSFSYFKNLSAEHGSLYNPIYAHLDKSVGTSTKICTHDTSHTQEQQK